jgi:hypothetical protein
LLFLQISLPCFSLPVVTFFLVFPNYRCPPPCFSLSSTSSSHAWCYNSSSPPQSVGWSCSAPASTTSSYFSSCWRHHKLMPILARPLAHIARPSLLHARIRLATNTFITQDDTIIESRAFCRIDLTSLVQIAMVMVQLVDMAVREGQPVPLCGSGPWCNSWTSGDRRRLHNGRQPCALPHSEYAIPSVERRARRNVVPVSPSSLDGDSRIPSSGPVRGGQHGYGHDD